MKGVEIKRIIGSASGKDKNILLTFNENYLYQTGNLIMSLNKYNDGLFFYLFCDNITKTMEDYLFSVCKNIKMYEFSLNLNIRSKLKSKDWPSLMVLRLFAPFLIEDNISNLLYMDSDVICKGCLDELFDYLKYNDNFIIAMAPEVSGSNLFDDRSRIFYDKYPVDLYCNSGVCMINIAKYKNEYSFDEIYSELEKNSNNLDCPDQDFLNYYFNVKIHFIRQEYNLLLYEYKGTPMYKLALSRAKLIHFTIKPWNWKSKLYMKTVYLKYSNDKKMIKMVKKAMVKGIFLNPIRIFLHFIKRKIIKR